MRIEPRDASGRRLARVELDERARPARVALGGRSGEVFLRWEGALDDASALRRCVICGSADLYARKNFPQVTPFVVALAFGGVAVAVLGYTANPVVFALLAALLAIDVIVLLVAQRQLVCYGCGSIYTSLRIARYHRPWDRAVAERVAKSPPELPAALANPGVAAGGSTDGMAVTFDEASDRTSGATPEGAARVAGPDAKVVGREGA